MTVLPLAVAYAGFSYGGQHGLNGRAAEARRAENWSQPAPLHQLRGLGERCKLLQRGPGRRPGRQAVLPIFKCTR